MRNHFPLVDVDVKCQLISIFWCKFIWHALILQNHEQNYSK